MCIRDSCYTGQGKLQVDVVQLKGADLESFLSAEGGREQAMESRRRWSSFLDAATGYNAKQRGDKAKEDAKKFSKAKSAIKMTRKSIEMSSTVTQETIDKAETMIAELEAMIERGEAPSEGKVKKLSELVWGVGLDFDALLKPYEERYERVKELSDQDKKRLYLTVSYTHLRAHET